VVGCGEKKEKRELKTACNGRANKGGAKKEQIQRNNGKGLMVLGKKKKGQRYGEWNFGSFSRR